MPLFMVVYDYLDDIVLASPTAETYYTVIDELHKTLYKYNQKLRIDKCSTAQSEVKYLGFLINVNGVRPDPKRIATVKNFTPPTNQTQLRGFNGAVSYFRNFIPNFAHIAHPLTQLTREDAPCTVIPLY